MKKDLIRHPSNKPHDVARDSFFINGVDVERRVGEDEVEAAGGVVRGVVVAVEVAAVFDFAFEAVDGEVQAAEAAGFVGFLDAVDGQLASWVT